ncbi:hypothetical protein CPB85DRAFT_1280179 [Mucidula mucida]|nr:hypothetical protein CPB85DRAFT_1280179 [Mucidula mucida]
MHSFAPVAAILLLASLLNLGYLGHRNRWYKISRQKIYVLYAYRGHDFPQYLPLPNSVLDEVLLTVEESVRFQVAGTASDADWFSLQLGTSSAGYVRLGSEERVFVVNMFHELHCLRLLNLAFDADPAKVVAEGHIQHCLNYLRQLTMCATHVCRDWNTVYAVVEENFAQWNASKSSSSST